MSKSSEIKGRKAAKKDNQVAIRKYRKHIPYGALKKATYSSDDELVGIVNKSKERQQTKLHLKNILSQISLEESLEELDALENDIYNN